MIRRAWFDKRVIEHWGRQVNNSQLFTFDNLQLSNVTQGRRCEEPSLDRAYRDRGAGDGASRRVAQHDVVALAFADMIGGFHGGPDISQVDVL